MLKGASKKKYKKPFIVKYGALAALILGSGGPLPDSGGETSREPA